MLAFLALASLSYLLGSLPFGLFAGRMKGIDLRQHGSGNVGATNVVRVLGKPIGFTVFFLDFLKGLIPTVWFPGVAIAHGSQGSVDSLALAFGVAAVIGHVFSVWLRFKGGKGVATSAGLCCGLDWRATLIAFAIWYLVLKVSKYVSLASIASAIAFPLVFIALTGPEHAFGERRIVTFVAVLLAVVIVYTHRSNIGRLLRGEELRVGAVRTGGKRP